MKAAITTLEIALHNLETNEPINRKEGNVEQADKQLADAAEIREAIDVLIMKHAVSPGGPLAP